jgi:hypothetical protein
MESNRANKATIWSAMLLFVAGLVLLGIGSRDGSEWARRLGALSCASFLFMPVFLLFIRPGLVIVWVNFCLRIILSGRRYTNIFSGELESPQWSELSDADKTSTFIIAFICLVIGVMILLDTFVSSF